MMGSIGRKGAGEWSEVLLTVLLCACIMVVVLKIPEIVSGILTTFSVASGEKLARDLGGLVTVSGAAQDSISIYYESEAQHVSYDVEISNRMVHVTGIHTEEGRIVSTPIVETGWGKIGVGEISDEYSQSSFVVGKTVEIESRTSTGSEGTKADQKSGLVIDKIGQYELVDVYYVK